jgi:hypothetical protein
MSHKNIVTSIRKWEQIFKYGHYNHCQKFLMFFALVNTEFSAIDTEMTDLNGHIQIMCLDCHPLNCMYLLTVYCVTPLSPPLFTALNLNFLTFLAFLTFNCDSDEEQSRAEQSKAKQTKAKPSLHNCAVMDSRPLWPLWRPFTDWVVSNCFPFISADISTLPHFLSLTYRT